MNESLPKDVNFFGSEADNLFNIFSCHVRRGKPFYLLGVNLIDS